RLLILAIILQTAVDVRDKLGEREQTLAISSLLLAAGVCVGTHLTALLGGLWTSRGLGFDRPSQIAVAFSCSQKTLPVALVLFKEYFQEQYPLAVVSIFCYHMGQLIVDTFIADGLAGRPKSEPPLTALPPETVV